MIKHKSILVTLFLAFIIGFTYSFNTFFQVKELLTYAEEAKNLPQIIRVGEEEVKKDMVNLPVGIVGVPYKTTKIFTANTYDKVSIKPYANNVRGCLPEGLIFDDKTNEITGTPKKAIDDGITIYCNNEYGSTNILAWIQIFSQEDKITLTNEAMPDKAYVDSLYNAMVEVGGYNQHYIVTLEGVEGIDYPTGMEAYKNGTYACVQFTPTAEMAGKTYNFTLCVSNGFSETRKPCTITVANEVIAPEIITEMQPLGATDDNKYGKRALVGKSFEFWLQAIGTSTEEHPLTFFAYESVEKRATPNEKGEYDLGNGLFLRKDGLIYSDCVLEVKGQGNGSNRQKDLRIGVSNINAHGEEIDSGYNYGYCFLLIVKGYMIDSFTISPQNTDIPRGGQRQFTANIEGFGEFDKTVTWSLYGRRTDNNTRIDSDGLLTIGANETSTDLWVQANVKNRYAQTEYINIIDHIHSTHLVEAAAKTCTTDGNIEHYKCDSCGGMFSDSKAINTLKEEEVIIKAGHEYTEMIGQQNATCIAKGMKAHFECKNCTKLFELGSLNEVIAQSLELPIDPNGHCSEHVSGSAATCANEGVYPHEYCTLCNKNYYSDGITEMVNVIEQKNDNHILEETWTATAEGHYHKCSRNGCKDNGCVEFAKHIPNRSEATNDEPIKCEICNYIITPAIEHKHHLSLVLGKVSTCFEDGKKAYYICDGCSLIFEDEEGKIAITIDIDSYINILKAHKFNEWIEEIKATKENTGIKAHKDCIYCGKHFDKNDNEIKDITIPKLPSSYEDNKRQGLSSKAIACIVASSILIVGIVAFAIFYFVIKKKTFKELIESIFKKE